MGRQPLARVRLNAERETNMMLRNKVAVKALATLLIAIAHINAWNRLNVDVRQMVGSGKDRIFLPHGAV
jgi:hypothetical protein